MTTPTDERSAKIAGNLATPPTKLVDQFGRELSSAGVSDPAAVSTPQLQQLLVTGNRFDIDTFADWFYDQTGADRKLEFLDEALGPEGFDILTADGMNMIRRADMSLVRFDRFKLSIDAQEANLKEYQSLRIQLARGFREFDAITGIVLAQQDADGNIKPFDPTDEFQVRLMLNLRESVTMWVASGLGKPELLELNPDELLQAVADFPGATKLAFDLSHPELEGRVSGESINYAIGSEFPKLEIGRGTDENGRKFIFPVPSADTGKMMTFGPMEL